MARSLPGGGYVGGRGRQATGFEIVWQNAQEVSRRLGQIGDGLAWDDNDNLVPRRTAANREMRAAAKSIAQDLLIPQMKRTARVSRTRIAPAMAETARAKSDRLIMVQVGGVNPALRGFRRGVGAKRAKGQAASGRDASSRTFRTTLAWGSEFGPKGGRSKAGRTGWRAPSGPVNHYRAPRNESGYWVLPAVRDVQARAIDRFQRAIDDVIAKYTGGWR